MNYFVLKKIARDGTTLSYDAAIHNSRTGCPAIWYIWGCDLRLCDTELEARQNGGTHLCSTCWPLEYC